MSIESGQLLPSFEALIEPEASRALARDYACTLVLSPDVTVRAARRRSGGGVGVDSDAEGGAGGQRVPVFPGGVWEYINADSAQLRECYEMVLRDAESDGGQYLTGMVQQEIERLQVGKWLSMNERKALRESNAGPGGHDKGKL